MKLETKYILIIVIQLVIILFLTYLVFAFIMWREYIMSCMVQSPLEKWGYDFINWLFGEGHLHG